MPKKETFECKNECRQVIHGRLFIGGEDQEMTPGLTPCSQIKYKVVQI
jgi:hypothetical protein